MSRILKIIAVIVGVLLGIVGLFLLFVWVRSNSILNKAYDAPEIAISVPTDEEAIERGRYLATVISVCIDCHGTDFGGGVVVDDPALGIVIAPNLTTGENGLGTELTDDDFARVLRYGVLPDGKSVRVMPSDDYTHMSLTDMGAVIAYVRSLPPVDSDWPETKLKLLGRILLATGQLPIMIADRIDFAAARPEPEPGVTLEYGAYLANIAGCTGCHGPGLAGGMIPGAPPDWPQAANLTPSGEVGMWSETQFIETIRTGVNPEGRQLVNEMPWRYYAQMTDAELQAIWLFVHSVPAKEAGTR